MPILGLKAPGPSHPPHFSLEPLIRPNILALQPYRCARDDYSAGILLDANENALGPSLPALSSRNKTAPPLLDGKSRTIDEPMSVESVPTAPGTKTATINGEVPETLRHSTIDDLVPPSDPIAEEVLALLSEGDVASLNRYPSPTHDEVKRSIAKFRGVENEDWVFLGVGSDEVIDMLYRVLCVPGRDQVMTTPPTYGMYTVTANVNDIGVIQVPLITKDGRFEIDEKAMNDGFVAHPDLKILFLCSPGNPTGTLIPLDAIERILQNTNFRGVVVIDEAYIDFAPSGSSAAGLVSKYANVCVTQTLSKSFGLAAIRLGYLLAPPPLIQILTNTKAPYNISLPTAALASSALSLPGLSSMAKAVFTLNENRSTLIDMLQKTSGVGRVLGGNHANFVMAQMLDKQGKPSNEVAVMVYKTMAESKGVVVRFRGGEVGCTGCLRITVGTEEECKEAVQQITALLEELRS